MDSDIRQHGWDVCDLDGDGDGVACDCNPTASWDPSSVPLNCQESPKTS